MPENDEQGISVRAQVPAKTALEKFEREQLTRRQALRKFGITSAMATFAMFSVDDLARMVGKAMEQRVGDNKIAGQIAQEFQQAGIALATTDSTYPCTGCSGSCVPDDDYDCVDCDSSCVVSYGGFGKKQQAKMPASCKNQNGITANCEACMADCQKLCLKKQGVYKAGACNNAAPICHLKCDEDKPDDGGADIWNCWKQYC